MSSDTCNMRSCRRTVRSDYPYYPYCHDHRMYSSQYMELAHPDNHGVSVAPPPSIAKTEHRLAKSYIAHTNVHPDIATNLTLAVMEWSGDDDLTIPSKAINRMDSAAWELRDQLELLGTNSNRISRVELRGMNRRTLSGRIQSDQDYVHNVILLDSGSPHEVVVDPVISVFAPVYDSNNSVEDELGSGTTPFGDAPWIGRQEDYVRGYHLWWSSSRAVGWK